MTNIVVQNFKANKFVAFNKHGEIIPVQKVAELLQGLMRENKRIQNCYVSLYKDNVEYIRQIGSHATAEQRKVFCNTRDCLKHGKLRVIITGIMLTNRAESLKHIRNDLIQLNLS